MWRMLQPIVETLCKNRVILASQSPRRKDLMELMGFKNFEIIPSSFPEDLDPKNFNSLAEYVEETAYQKVVDVREKVLKSGQTPALICGADTIVTLDNEIFGKPKDAEDANKTLSRLSGRTNTVYTSVILMFPKKIYRFTESTKVTFGNISPERIKEYVASGEPLDKAGSYGIQGYGSTLIEKIDGDVYTVYGLPVYRIVEKLLDYQRQFREHGDC